MPEECSLIYPVMTYITLCVTVNHSMHLSTDHVCHVTLRVHDITIISFVYYIHTTTVERNYDVVKIEGYHRVCISTYIMIRLLVISIGVE